MHRSERLWREEIAALWPETSAWPVAERAEVQLLIECAQTVIESGTAERINFLLRHQLNWDYILRAAQRNCIVPLLNRNLPGLGGHHVPPSVQSELRATAHANAQHNLLMTGKLAEIIKLLDAHGIAALAFKGPTLALQAYGDLSLRQFADLDVLVRKRDLSRALEALAFIGYQPLSPLTWRRILTTPLHRHKDIGLMSADGRVPLELHWQLSGAHFALPLSLESLWQHLETISLANVPVRVLPFAELLIYLCLHGSRHGWGRLGWISDVAELIRTQAVINWTEVLWKAKLLGCERVLFLGLYLVDDFWGLADALPEWETIRHNGALPAISAQVRSWLFGNHEGNLALGDWYCYHLGLKERWHDQWRLRLHYYYRYLHLALTPNEEDKNTLSLPYLLSPLYYLVRPARLLRNYRQRSPIAYTEKRRR